MLDSVQCIELKPPTGINEVLKTRQKHRYPFLTSGSYVAFHKDIAMLAGKVAQFPVMC